ncbi:hypothetical protein EXIGLDRAFT_846156 [Exidia glandulosa HHB12029]|uniref:Uncharacterized protein n=1 Tax=Exidia glandulosa HHB12029 TaxID=1314781 RepID=A0A165B505_EXIGL|nr:hypothetical protein EXIGLDRAFT_846156 [Exidia glandulosa HHB12029]
MGHNDAAHVRSSSRLAHSFYLKQKAKARVVRESRQCLAQRMSAQNALINQPPRTIGLRLHYACSSLLWLAQVQCPRDIIFHV